MILQKIIGLRSVKCALRSVKYIFDKVWHKKC